MRKLLLLLPCLVPLCGFAQPPFDASAATKAGAARKQSLEACGARTDFKSSTEVVDCVVAADKVFAHAVHLRDPKLLDDYAVGIRALDAGIVTGSFKPEDIGKNFRALQDKFFKTMNEQYAEYQTSLAEDLSNAADQTRTMPGMDHGTSMTNNMSGSSGMGN